MTDMQNDIALYDEEDTLHGKYLVFELDKQEFAISIRHVVDIINVQPVTRVPNCPCYVSGVTNLRGKVIPIVDVRIRFGKDPQHYSERTCIIVVADGEVSVGLIIDSVSEVISLDDDQISSPPSFDGATESHFISGIGRAGNGIKLILDYAAVLSDDLLLGDINGELPA